MRGREKLEGERSKETERGQEETKGEGKIDKDRIDRERGKK